MASLPLREDVDADLLSEEHCVALLTKGATSLMPVNEWEDDTATKSYVYRTGPGAIEEKLIIAADELDSAVSKNNQRRGLVLIQQQQQRNSVPELKEMMTDPTLAKCYRLWPWEACPGLRQDVCRERAKISRRLGVGDLTNV